MVRKACYGIMRCLGTATGLACEAFYFVVPFMRPGEHEVPLRTGQRTDTGAQPPREQTAETHAWASKREYRPEDIRDILSFINFETNLQRIEADVYVKDAYSKPKALRKRALSQIGRLPAPIAVEILRRLLLIEQDPLQLVRILNALSQLNENGGLEKSLFLDFLDNPNPAVRLAALGAFAGYRDDDSFSQLAAALGDSDPQIRRQALNLLSWRHRDRSASFMLRMLRDPDSSVRSAAVATCGALRLQQSISPLISLLKDRDREIRQRAANSLKEITGQDFGFKTTARTKDRDKAIAAWHSWWHSNRATSGVRHERKGTGFVSGVRPRRP